MSDGKLYFRAATLTKGVELHSSGGAPATAEVLGAGCAPNYARLRATPPAIGGNLPKVSGVPVWTDFELRSPPAWGSAIADANGRARLTLRHPGGFTATLSFMALATTDPAIGELLLVTTRTLRLPLLP